MQPLLTPRCLEILDKIISMEESGFVAKEALLTKRLIEKSQERPEEFKNIKEKISEIEERYRKLSNRIDMLEHRF